MQFSKQIIDDAIAHAQAEAPNECCGIIAGKDGRATRLYRADNAEASPFRFVIGSKDQIRITSDIEDNGWDLAAIYHSHTRSAAYPSQTDVNFAAAWPGVVWLIVSLEHPEGADVRAFLIDDGQVQEVDVEVG